MFTNVIKKLALQEKMASNYLCKRLYAIADWLPRTTRWFPWVYIDRINERGKKHQPKNNRLLIVKGIYR